jgi:hypothetical protein
MDRKIPHNRKHNITSYELMDIICDEEYLAAKMPTILCRYYETRCLGKEGKSSYIRECSRLQITNKSIDVCIARH